MLLLLATAPLFEACMHCVCGNCMRKHHYVVFLSYQSVPLQDFGMKASKNGDATGVHPSPDGKWNQSQ